MKEYVLTRTGDRPLKFSGELIAQVDGRIFAGQEQNRWHELRVYKTASGKYVLEVSYYTQWQGESCHHQASVHDTVAGVADEIRVTNPLEHLLGYPPHLQFAEKQARLEESLQQRWGVLVSEILNDLPDAAEVIE